MKQDTAQQILDAAQLMVRNRGYSAFSYADIAKEVGIRKASIHYHFPSKEDLVKELVIRYRDNLVRQCQTIEQQLITPQEQFKRFISLYRNGLEENQICLCGMLTADFVVLSPEIQEELKTFFAAAELWLTRLLQRGSEAKVWQCAQSCELEAKSIIAMLQGAQLLSRAADNSAETFDQVTGDFFKDKIESE